MTRKQVLLVFTMVVVLLGVAALQNVFATRNSSAQGLSTPLETWKTGVTLENGASFTGTEGRLLTSNATFRSNLGSSDMYFAFPAPATARSVQSASVMVASRSGSYSGQATITLEVYSFDGSLQHTVSASAVDLQAASILTWSTFTVSSTPGNLTIDPGQYLAVHFHLDGAAAGDLDVQPVFDVLVQ